MEEIIPKEYIPVIASIGAACFTAFASIVVVVIGKSIDHKRELAYKNRADKYKLYKEFIDHIFDVYFCNEGIKKNISPKKEVATLHDFTKRIILWGDNKVLKSYSQFVSYIRGDYGEVSLRKATKQLENLIKAIRKDLGCGGMFLKTGTITRLHINDYKNIKQQDKINKQEAKGKI